MKMAFRSYSVLYSLPSPPLSVSLFLCVSVSVSLSCSVALSLSRSPFCGLIADSGTIVLTGTQARTWQSQGLTCQLPPLLPSPCRTPSLLTHGSKVHRRGSLGGKSGYSNQELSTAICPRGGEDMRIAGERVRGEALGWPCLVAVGRPIRQKLIASPHHAPAPLLPALGAGRQA